MLKCLVLSLLVFSMINAQFAQWDSYNKDEDDIFNHCNESFCNLPCKGAKRPPYCPIRLPLPEACPSKCACMVICEKHSVTCFELKYCQHRPRTFTRRRKSREQPWN